MRAPPPSMRILAVLFLGMGIGAWGYLVQRPSETIVVRILALSPATECEMQWSLNSKRMWQSLGSFHDGGGKLHCHEQVEILPGVHVVCVCE
jgi:hypothetical protein